MECRTSLFIKNDASKRLDCANVHVSSPSSPPVSRRPVFRQNSSANSRYGTSPPTPQQRPAVEKIPLPLPRNLVLISLLETASKRHATLLGGNATLMDSYSDTDNSITNEEDAVLDSIDALSSPCGTYVVKERYGLPVYNGNSTNQDTMDDANEAITTATKPNKLLNYGQKVQVVDVHEGMYQLARGEGVVFANSTQLVKVGVAKERSCKVEGMLKTLQSKKAKLLEALDDLQKVESNLKEEFSECLSRPATHPVVEEPAQTDLLQDNCFSPSDDHGHDFNDRRRSISTTHSDNMTSSYASTPNNQQDISASGSSMFIIEDSIVTPTPASPNALSTPKARKSPTHSLGSKFESISPFGSGIMCGGSLIPLFRGLDDEDDYPERRRIPIRRPEGEDTSGRSFDSVDFRTGFSGHIALNHARKNLSSHGSRAAIRMMGEHRGIAPIKNIRTRNPNASPIGVKKTW